MSQTVLRIAAFVTITLVAIHNMSAVHADSNATGGDVLNSETQTFTGPFDAVGIPGEVGNGTWSGSYTGGFTANSIEFSGQQTSLVAGTWGADMLIEASPGVGDPLQFRPNGNLQTYSGSVLFAGSIDDLTGTYPTGIDPAGTWNFEVADTFNDGPGVEQTLDSLTLTFREIIPISDTSGSFSAGTMAIGDTYDTVGEFAFGGLLDTYTLTLAESSILSMSTFSDPTGFTGNDADTEIALFDSAGNLLLTDDDGGAGLFSSLNATLAAGDYTIAVGSFDTNFEDVTTLAAVVGGNGLGDYAMSLSVTAIPEPGSWAALTLIGSALLYRRRRSKLSSGDSTAG